MIIANHLVLNNRMSSQRILAPSSPRISELPRGTSIRVKSMVNVAKILRQDSFSPIRKRANTEVSEDTSSPIEKGWKKEFKPKLDMKKLSPMKNKQYETKIKISGESWMAYDYQQGVYKRGWKPSNEDQFSGLMRLVLLKTFLELSLSNPWMQQFRMHVSDKCLKQEVELARERSLSPSKRKKLGIVKEEAIQRCLMTDTIISMRDILFGLLMTSYEDILEYAIMFMGYLCYCHQEGITPQQDSNCHLIEKPKHARAYSDYLAQYLNMQLFPNILELSPDSYFTPSNYYLQSTCNDMCKLFLSIQNEPLFQQIIQQKADYVCAIKVKVGNYYWENRTVTWKNSRVKFVNSNLNGIVSNPLNFSRINFFQQSPRKDDQKLRKVTRGQNGKIIYSESDYLCILNWRNCKKKNFSVVCRNLTLESLIIIRESKFGMAECDVQMIEGWLEGMKKPVVEFKRSLNKLPALERNSEGIQKLLKMKGVSSSQCRIKTLSSQAMAELHRKRAGSDNFTSQASESDDDQLAEATPRLPSINE